MSTIRNPKPPAPQSASLFIDSQVLPPRSALKQYPAKQTALKQFPSVKLPSAPIPIPTLKPPANILKPPANIPLQPTPISTPTIVKKGGGPNENGVSILMQIQARARQLKDEDPTLKHRTAIAIAGQEYRDYHGTPRAHVKKSKSKKK